MRIFPLITAGLVTGALYLAVLDRPALISFASGQAFALMRKDPEVAPNAEAQPAQNAPDTATVPAQAPAPISVVAMQSTAQAINTAVLLRGRTEAVRSVAVRSETSARVISEPRQRGSFVDTGDVLCQLDPGTSHAALAEAQARLAEARINHRAAEQLLQEGYASETRRASTQAALQSAQAAVEIAERAISYLTIRAPFGGLLETDSAELGTLLRPGDLCASVILLDPILLVGFVPETDIDRISAGARAAARLATGAEVTGTVSFLSRAADPDTRTFRVEATVPNPDLSIRDGQTAEIRIETAGTRAHLLPGSALTLDDDGVMGVRIVAEGNIARFVPLHVIRDTVHGVWVTGLPETAAVIVTGQEYVTDGVRVAPTFVKQPLPPAGVTK